MVADKIQIGAGGVTHYTIVRQCFNMSVFMRSLTEREMTQTLARGDKTNKPVNYDGCSTAPAETAIYKGWNFQ